MPSSWSESNRMHSTNKRIEAADYSIHEDADKYEGDEGEEVAEQQFFSDYENNAPDDSYLDDPFPTYDYNEPPDHYLDAAYEDRYYLPEPYIEF